MAESIKHTACCFSSHRRHCSRCRTTSPWTHTQNYFHDTAIISMQNPNYVVSIDSRRKLGSTSSEQSFFPRIRNHNTLTQTTVPNSSPIFKKISMITNPHKFKTLEFRKPRRILPSSDLQLLKTYKTKWRQGGPSNKRVHERSYWYRRRATKQKCLHKLQIQSSAAAAAADHHICHKKQKRFLGF